MLKNLRKINDLQLGALKTKGKSILFESRLLKTSFCLLFFVFLRQSHLLRFISLPVALLFFPASGFMGSTAPHHHRGGREAVILRFGCHRGARIYNKKHCKIISFFDVDSVDAFSLITLLPGSMTKPFASLQFDSLRLAPFSRRRFHDPFAQHHHHRGGSEEQVRTYWKWMLQPKFITSPQPHHRGGGGPVFQNI